MLKKIKKLGVGILSAFMIVSVPTQSLASEYGEGDMMSETFNEYEMVLEAREKLSMKKNEATEEELKELEELNSFEANYEQHINEISKFTNDELVNLGYDSSQIEAIRNFDGSEESIHKSSARVNLSISKNSSSQSSSKSRINVKVRFVWSGTPTTQFTDGFGVTNGEGMYFDNYNTPFSATYISSTGSQRTWSGSLTRQGNGNTGATTKVPVYRSAGALRYYLRSGSANVGMNRSSRVNQCGIGIAYGHSYLKPSISISISGTGSSIGISFGSGVTKYSTNKVYTL